jgi:uncharacterized protein YcfJ
MRVLTTTMIVTSMLLGLPAWAGHGHRPKWAKVVRSAPVYESFRVVTPQRECWSDGGGHRRSHARGHLWVAPAIVGAVIGGAIGSELGRAPHDERAGAVVGAVLGGAFGHELGHARHASFGRPHGRVSRRHREVCAVREVVSVERRLVGYDVDYRYRGRIYHTRLAGEPGTRIRVSETPQPFHERQQGGRPVEPHRRERR